MFAALFIAGIAAIIGGAIGGYAGYKKYQEDVEAGTKELEREAIRAGMEYDEETGEWVPSGSGETRARERRNKRQARMAGKVYEQQETALNRQYETLLTENVEGQAENRRLASQEVLAGTEQQALGAGSATAGLAQSNVRRTGSASNLLTEGTRMFNLNLEELDRQLGVQEEGFGRQRTAMKAERDEAISGRQLSLEEKLEGLADEDVDLTGVEDVGAFIEGLDYTDTLLTETAAQELSWMQEDIEDLDLADYTKEGWLTGASFGFNAFK